MKSLDDSEYNVYDPSCSCTKELGCTGYTYSKPDCRGTVVYDEHFDLFHAETQEVLRGACSSLKSWPCHADKCDFGLLVRPNSTVCFLPAFEAWASSAKAADVKAMVGDEAQRGAYMDLLFEFRGSQYPLGDSSKSYDEVIGFTGKRLVHQGPSYVQVQATMTMPLLMPLAGKYKIQDAARAYVDSIPTPATARHVFQHTFDWVWGWTQAGTVQGLTSGMAIAFPVAFLALLLATTNFVLAFFACVSVGGIVATVLGYCYLNGWALGPPEAIAGVMVIGLSVDYTIHLAHMYDHAAFEVGAETRLERCIFAANTMVGTVLGGAITTCGAGAFMFLCVQSFFYKMATLICFTIAFSVVYALFWFLPLMTLIGPEGDFGHISLPWTKAEEGKKYANV
jgi:hypothetical protein